MSFALSASFCMAPNRPELTGPGAELRLDDKEVRFGAGERRASAKIGGSTGKRSPQDEGKSTPASSYSQAAHDCSTVEMVLLVQPKEPVIYDGDAVQVTYFIGPSCYI